jgi:hypothetical protein
VLLDGISFIVLDKLIELKLASGMTNAGRYKDLADVQELIKTLHLSADYAQQLNPYVQPAFLDLWRASQQRYVKPWQLKTATSRPFSMEELIRQAPESADVLRAMQQAGVVVEAAESGAGSRLLLVTTNAEIAAKYDMIPEFDYWDEIQ